MITILSANENDKLSLPPFDRAFMDALNQLVSGEGGEGKKKNRHETRLRNVMYCRP